MKRCTRLADSGRRHFLMRAGVITAGAVTASVIPQKTEANTNQALLDYPTTRLANIKDLKENEPLEITYPDPDAPGVLLKLGAPIEGGAGPDSDIVGFSVTCPHKGFPLNYESNEKIFSCPGHYSRFDPEKGGQQIMGQATQNLPQYILRIDDNGDIFAEGIDELLYGRLSNIL